MDSDLKTLLSVAFPRSMVTPSSATGYPKDAIELPRDILLDLMNDTDKFVKFFRRNYGCLASKPLLVYARGSHTDEYGFWSSDS